MKAKTHYSPTENGFAISGSSEVFNRTLYGSHKNDDRSGRFFTFAGDAPLFMGAITDWTKNLCAYQEKSGVLASGLAITPGKRNKFYYSDEIDQTSRWFHNSEDILAEFKPGWMEYELSQISSWFPDVYVNIEAYPLLPEDGYLVHYHITTDQRVHFVAGFGGITDLIGRFEYREVTRRRFSAEDTKGNVIELGDNRACITHTDGKKMRIAASFPAEFGIGSAKTMSEPYPSMFMSSSPENDDDRVVKLSAVIEPGKDFDGYIVVMRDEDDAALDKWLSMDNPINFIKQQIYAKFDCMDVATPERTLDLTIPPTVMAIDASWHGDSFHHGAFAYHTPFLGWRNWYAPTNLGWGKRVEKTMDKYLSLITKGDVSQERVWYDDSVIPEGESRFDRRFHNVDNPIGRLPSLFSYDGKPMYAPYNMQECAMDMMLYYVEWSGRTEVAEKYYDELCSMIESETRLYDPDNDGLYQNILNTWISDGHNYNGAGCAQSSAYNYRANLVMAKIAKKLGKNSDVFEKRAEKIKAALNEKLWIANEGVIAESLDTIGNCLIHPSVELPTVYHVIDSDMIDHFRAYRTLRFTENHIKNIETSGFGGRLCYSSNWLPKQYSNCGLFPAENAHLALAYFQTGLKKEGKKILDGIADCYFTGRNPGFASHIQSARGTSDFGDQDFSDVSSTYLRLVVEGLFGIRINNLDGYIRIAPGFPEDWEHASLELKDISLRYNRWNNREVFTVYTERTEKKIVKIPMRGAGVEAVLLDGEPVEYKVAAAPNNSFIMVETEKTGRFKLSVMHSNSPIPTVTFPENILSGNKISFEVKGAEIAEVFDVSETLDDIRVVSNKIYAKAKAVPGDHTLFIRTVSGEYDAWFGADYEIINEDACEEILEEKPFEPVDIREFFNCSMTEVHNQAYIQPRPKGFSMSMYQNGRYSHNWTQSGRDVVNVDDSLFRNSGGTVYSPSGIPFATPAENDNLACVSIFDVFPTDITVPLSGKGQELAILFVASTCCLHSYVENVRITVNYADGTSTGTKLVYPLNIDDWLTSALTTEAEIFYFSDFNHATVQRLRIDPKKELANIKIEAVANELILGVAGISISR